MIKKHWITSEEDVNKYSISSITNLDKAHDVAFLCLNTKEDVERKYRN